MKFIVMKRTCFTLMYWLLPALVFAQPQEKLLYCNITQQWNEQAGRWKNANRIDYQFDAKGQQVEELRTFWNDMDQVWNPPENYCYFYSICFHETGKVIFAYNDQGKLIKLTNYGWDSEDNHWVEINHEAWEFRSDEQPEWYERIVLEAQLMASNICIHTEYTYDDSGNLISEKELHRDQSGGDWILSTLEEISTIESENKKVVLTLDWDENQDKWVLKSRSDSIYNSMGLVSNWSFYSAISGTYWYPEDSASIIYNEQGLPLKEYRFSYISDMDEWYTMQETLCEYSPDGQLEERAEYYNNPEMDRTGLSRIQRLYNENGTLRQQRTFSWDMEGMDWIDHLLEEWSYDSVQHVVLEVERQWDADQGDWQLSGQKVYEYDASGNQTMMTSYDIQGSYDNELTAIERQLSFWALPDSIPLIILDPELLEALITEGVDTNNDGSISRTEAERVTRLDVSDRGITDLSGLEAFVHLDTLICNDNNLTENDLQILPWLTYLDCSGCGLSGLNVEQFSELKTLICSQNEFYKLDLSKSPQLEYLDLRGMPGLYEVCVWEDPFPPVGVVALTDGSSHIHFSEECSIFIPDPAFYEALLEEGVDLNGDSLITASEAAAVTELNISTGSIYDLTGLEYFYQLKRLDCSSNPISELDLKDLLELQFLDCSGCEMSVLNVSYLSNLQYLDCSNTYVQSLDLSGNPLLSTLMCAYCGLDHLDISGCIYLTYLDLAGNNLSGLSLAENLALTFIDISDMPQLGEVCVWQIPFPPSGTEVRYENSYQIHYDTECAMEQDRFENNDVRLEAAPLTDNVLYKALTVSAYDDDWYELIPLGETLIKSLVVECSFSNDSGDINMEILNAAGKKLAGANSRNDGETISIPMNPLERYYLRIHLDSGQINTYSLTWLSQVYTTNSSLGVCIPGQECQTFNLTPSLRDSMYVTDTLIFNLYAGDSATRSISLENYGPEAYSYYMTLECSRIVDDRNFALQFDGVDDRLEIQRDPCIDLSQGISLEVWIMLDDSGEGYEPIISRSLNGYGYELYSEFLNGTRKVGFRVDGGQVLSLDSLEPDRWYHVAVTYDSNLIRLYINGEKNAVASAPGAISVVNQSVVIGANNPMAQDPKYFAGKIDEIRIWSVARSFMEVMTNYQNKLTGNEPGLEAYYALDEAYTMVAVDRTGKTRATISGGAEGIPSTAPSVRMIHVNPQTSFVSKGAALPVKVTASAKDLSAGTYPLDLQLYSNVASHPDITIPVRLQVRDAASISIYPDTLDFGKMKIYETQSLDLVVANHGTQELVMDSLWTNVDGTRILPATRVIPPGESYTFQMDAFFRFEGSYHGSLQIPSNDPTNPSISLPVMAEAQGISGKVLLCTIEETILSGNTKIHGLSFPNPAENSGLSMVYSVNYLSISELRNDRFFKPDSANWLYTNLPKNWIMIEPGGTLRFGVVLDAAGLVAGDYYCELIFECYSPSKWIGLVPVILHVNPSDVGETKAHMDGLVLYPNPTSGPVTLLTRQTSPYLVTITSLTGQIMQQITAMDPEIRLDLSSLEKGIYLVTLRTTSGRITRRLIRY